MADKDTVVEVKDDEITTGDQTVDLDKKEDTKKEEPNYATKDDLQGIQKSLNYYSGLGRKYDDIDRRLTEIASAQKSMPRFEQPATDQRALRDAGVEKDWQGTVMEMASEIAKKEIAAYQRQQQEEANRKAIKDASDSTLEKSKQMVRSKYKDIDDPSSEISQRYIKIMQENPQYLNSEFGPVLVMRDMEDELKGEGRLDDFEKQIVDKEVTRRTRIGATGAANGIKSGNARQVTLTKEEVDMCKDSGIPIETFAKNKRLLEKGNRKEGITF